MTLVELLLATALAGYLLSNVLSGYFDVAKVQRKFDLQSSQAIGKWHFWNLIEKDFGQVGCLDLTSDQFDDFKKTKNMFFGPFKIILEDGQGPKGKSEEDFSLAMAQNNAPLLSILSDLATVKVDGLPKKFLPSSQVRLITSNSISHSARPTMVIYKTKPKKSEKKSLFDLYRIEVDNSITKAKPGESLFDKGQKVFSNLKHFSVELLSSKELEDAGKASLDGGGKKKQDDQAVQKKQFFVVTLVIVDEQEKEQVFEKKFLMFSANQPLEKKPEEKVDPKDGKKKDDGKPNDPESSQPASPVEGQVGEKS